MKKDTQWNPSIYKCETCGDEIYSRSPGNFVSCTCYKDRTKSTGGFVDQTEYYIRIGGNLSYTGRKLHDS